jgi:hypothetical protein
MRRRSKGLHRSCAWSFSGLEAGYVYLANGRFIRHVLKWVEALCHVAA